MYDVAVVGAGPVGLALAAFLLERGANVALIEARAEPVRHSRAIGIHPPSLEALESIGVASQIADEAVQITGGMAINRGRMLGKLSFDLPGSRYPFVASLQQHRTQELLERAVVERSPDALFRGYRVHGLARSGKGLVLDAASEEHSEALRLEARFVVGADGPHSVIRSLAHGQVTARVYPDTYVMGDFADGTTLGAQAVICLERGGVVETFPLPGGVRRWVAHWQTSRSPRSAEGLASVIHERTGHAVDPLSATMFSSFQPRRRLARRMLGERVAIVGDAAHEISPMGGQGMNLGWLDAFELGDALIRFLRSGDTTQLYAAERCRLAAAKRAARLAQLNMTAGRPASAIVDGFRVPAVRIAATPPLGNLAARLFTMQ